VSDEWTARHKLKLGIAFLGGLAVGSVGSIVVVGLVQSSFPERWPWYVWSIISTSGLIYLVTATWDKAPGVAHEPGVERDGIGLVCTFGAIGGLVRWLHTLFADPDSAYGATSFLGPLESAALALVVVLVLRAGLIGPATGDNAKAVNWLGLYAAAALTGLFAKEAIPKLAKVFGVIFGDSG
jgi:hypothetical protein